MTSNDFQNESDTDEPKLIIDEDWKSQVQREKELLKQKQQDGASQEDSASSEAESRSFEASESSASDQSQSQADSPPPASFEFLVSGIASQAVAAMGQLPDESGKPLPVNLDYARHFIDLLAVIESKTQGNLSDHEQRFLQDTMHQLRMLFVAVKNS